MLFIKKMSGRFCRPGPYLLTDPFPPFVEANSP
jgi:hypothetical protein